MGYLPCLRVKYMSSTVVRVVEGMVGTRRLCGWWTSVARRCLWALVLLLFMEWWAFAIGDGEWVSPSLVGVLASWAFLFESRRRRGTPGLTVGVPHQPFAGGAVGIDSY